MTPITYTDCHEAVRWGNAKAKLDRPIGIAFAVGSGWRLYDVIDGCPEGWEPDLLCFGGGKMPVPLSKAGQIIVSQMLDRSAK